MCDHQFIAPTNSGEVDHVHFLSQSIGNLYQNEECADITIVVNNERFYAHKVILASRCDYFRALLFGGMRESQPGVQEIELQDDKPQAFAVLLQYIYTGRVNLTTLKEEQLLNLLGMADKYGFPELAAAISEHLRQSLSLKNVCVVYDIANMYGLSKLCEQCLIFMDRNAGEVIKSEGFLLMAKTSLVDVIQRSSFCAPEIDIFDAAVNWSSRNNDSKIDIIISAVRLPLMTIDDLLRKVRPSGLVDANDILNAIDRRTHSKDTELNYRGVMIPEENVASLRHDAAVEKGEMTAALLDGDTSHYDLDRGFTRHGIDDDDMQGIVVRLGQPAIINTIRLLLWDKDTRSYSYYIEVSMDRKDWVKVVDHAKYLCRSWQQLHFDSRVVKFVRVVGTHNTVNRVFHVVALEALYTAKPFKLRDGLIAPSENVASEKLSAFVIEGVARTRNSLINGDTKNYDWDSGYTCHQLGSGCIVVQLAQPFYVDSILLLLWDCDERSYCYTVEVSIDNHKWHIVKDNSDRPCKSWQSIKFAARPVTFIKITGTRNSANEVFHIVHLECPAGRTSYDSSSDLDTSTSSFAIPGAAPSSPQAEGENDAHDEMWADLTED